MNERDFHDHHYAESSTAISSSALFARIHGRTARVFLRRTGVGRAHRILSLGCGDGAIERWLAPHVGEMVGIDISEVAIRKAREQAAQEGITNLHFVQAADESLRFDDLGEFDAVAAFAFLHHLRDAAIEETLYTVRKVLRPSGLLYSIDPSCHRFVGLFTGLVRATYDRHHSPDERELDPHVLSRLAVSAGFVTEIGYVDYFLGPGAWLLPRTPRWLTGPLEAVDNFALTVPWLRRYASSFSLLARPVA